MAQIPPISENILTQIARLLGKENTGTEITLLLQRSHLPDPTPQNTKWKRLYNSFVTFQSNKHVANNIIEYIKIALDPARFTQNKDHFLSLTANLNRILSFIELEFCEDGKMHKVKKAQTLSEAVLRAQRLKSLLEQRNIHPDILKFAESEIASDNYFHTTLEAMKSVTSKIRALTGIYADGAELIDNTLSGKNMCLAINSLKSISEQGEQRGFANLLKGTSIYSRIK